MFIFGLEQKSDVFVFKILAVQYIVIFFDHCYPGFTFLFSPPDIVSLAL